MQALATRHGSVASVPARMDITAMAWEDKQKRQEAREIIEREIEAAILKVRELRLAGMINKAGADEIQQRLIMAWSHVETL